jgi:hypothetical protein
MANDFSLDNFSSLLKGGSGASESSSAGSTTRSSYNSPLPENQAVYPFNNVTQTRSGHVFEVDDTLGSERIHEKHKSGTSRTIMPDGSAVITVIGDNHTTIIGSDFVTISGSANVTINGNANMTINGNYNVEVNGSMSHTVKSDYKLKIGGAYKAEISGDKAENIVGKKDLIVSAGINNTISGGGVKNNIVGGSESNISGDCNETITGSGNRTALMGVSMNSPAGPATVGGMSAAIDSATVLSMTSLGATNMTSTFTNMTTPCVNVLGGAVVASLDVFALGGARSMTTHMHLADAQAAAPGLTTPAIL